MEEVAGSVALLVFLKFLEVCSRPPRLGDCAAVFNDVGGVISRDSVSKIR